MTTDEGDAWPVHLMHLGWTVCGVDDQAPGVATTTDLDLVTCRACRQGV